MRRRRCGAILGAALGLLTSALPAAAAEPEPHGAVSGVTVTGHKPDVGPSNAQLLHLVPCSLPRPAGQAATAPYVVDSYPKPGQQVAPGLIFLRVTFSEPMSRCGFLLTPIGSTAEPELMDAKARLSSDLRSFFFVARTQPGATYAVSFNTDQQPAHFRSLFGEIGAKTYELTFSTSRGEPLRSVDQALRGDPRLTEFLKMSGRVIELWILRKRAAGAICGNCGGEPIDGGPALHSAFVQVRSAEGAADIVKAVKAPPTPPPGYHPGLDAF